LGNCSWENHIQEIFVCEKLVAPLFVFEGLFTHSLLYMNTTFDIAMNLKTLTPGFSDNDPCNDIDEVKPSFIPRNLTRSFTLRSSFTTSILDAIAAGSEGCKYQYCFILSQEI